MLSFPRYQPEVAGGGKTMYNRILIITALLIGVLSLVFAASCSSIPGLTTQTSSGPEIVRQTELGSQWRVCQMRLNVDAGSESLVLLKLVENDEVDGYYFLEKGKDINFNITGDSLIFESKPPADASTNDITSDRFSFVASKAQGSTYSLIFQNPADEDNKQATLTVFLEVIFPDTGTIFSPVEK
jgi:hypothetical protein